MDVAPYLSLVATARNDDHGGNFLRRMQAFTSGWIAQTNRYQLSSELILVNWNPVPDRPRLRDALSWPERPQYCEVRFIEVPGDLHRQYTHAGALPLYQMIAKNVGIRRARGKFILATNIDILFSGELMAYLAQKQLQPGRMYRIDRYDVDAGVPDATIQEQLDYCRSHLLRINKREGTFPVIRNVRKADGPPDGEPPHSAPPDIAPPGSGIQLGDGWFSVERCPGLPIFRWVENDAEIALDELAKGRSVLSLDIEPGPGMGQKPMSLGVYENESLVASVRIARRSSLRIGFPDASKLRRLRLHANGGGLPIESDPRIMNFRVFSCQWETLNGLGRFAGRAQVRRTSIWRRVGILQERLKALAARIAEGGPVTVTLPVSGLLRRVALVCAGSSVQARAPQSPVQPAAPERPPLLHTNACGDFTLLSREKWFDLRGYPEFDLHSMNIDSVFCCSAHFGGVLEEVLADPMRIYHIEHGTGSGWTPEGEEILFERLRQKGIPWLPSQEVLDWATQMRRMNSPMIFNHENWGLADHTLPETHLPTP